MGEYAKKALKTYRRWEKNPPTKRDQADQPTYVLEESLEEDKRGVPDLPIEDIPSPAIRQEMRRLGISAATFYGRGGAVSFYALNPPQESGRLLCSLIAIRDGQAIAEDDDPDAFAKLAQDCGVVI